MLSTLSNLNLEESENLSQKRDESQETNSDNLNDENHSDTKSSKDDFLKSQDNDEMATRNLEDEFTADEYALQLHQQQHLSSYANSIGSKTKHSNIGGKTVQQNITAGVVLERRGRPPPNSVAATSHQSGQVKSNRDLKSSKSTKEVPDSR